MQPQGDITSYYQHSGSTKAALQAVLTFERCTQGTHHRVALKAFDRTHVTVFTSCGEDDARANGFVIEQYRTGATDTVFAGKMGAC
jgi:hypothetical protein